jgi:predicted enzyme related to lactoylglutathione lyase
MSSVPPTVGAATDDADDIPLDASTLGASLTVTDLPASLAWYRDVLGFTVTRTHDRAGTIFAASLRAGAVAILLTQDDGARGLSRTRGDGFSLMLTTSQDIDALAKRIQVRGGTLLAEPADVMGARAFRLLDPDGFKFVFSSPR